MDNVLPLPNTCQLNASDMRFTVCAYQATGISASGASAIRGYDLLLGGYPASNQHLWEGTWINVLLQAPLGVMLAGFQRETQRTTTIWGVTKKRHTHVHHSFSQLAAEHGVQEHARHIWRSRAELDQRSAQHIRASDSQKTCKRNLSSPQNNEEPFSGSIMLSAQSNNLIQQASSKEWRTTTPGDKHKSCNICGGCAFWHQGHKFAQDTFSKKQQTKTRTLCITNLR